MIPNFKKMSSQEIKQFMHISKIRICKDCKGSKEQNSGNSFYCVACIEKHKIKQEGLKQSQNKFDKFAKQYPQLDFDKIVELYKLQEVK